MLLKKSTIDLSKVTLAGLKSQFLFSNKIIRHHLEVAWETEFKQKATIDLQYLKQSSGHILRGDHTYKFVKSLGGFDEESNK